MMIKIKVISFLLVLINAEIRFPAMPHVKNTTMISIEDTGILLKSSIQICSIFCHIAIHTAHNMPIGTKNRKYLSVTSRIFGILFFSVGINGFPVNNLS